MVAAAKGEAETMRETVFDAAKVREKILVVAAVCHAANREYAKTLGDHSIPSWEIAPMWMRASVINGVEFHIERLAAGETATPAASHENWLKMKAADGWKFGPTKDAGLKTHPCIVPFAELPPEQQRKDWIFAAICEAFWKADTPAMQTTGECNPEPVAAG